MMTRSLKLVLSSIFITLIILGLSSPVAAQQPPPPTIYVDAPSSVNVSTEFDIVMWIRDIPAGWGLYGFEIPLHWDPNDLEYIECEFLGDDRPGGDGGCALLTWVGPGILEVGGLDERDFPATRWTEDAAWLRVRFHCLRAGPAAISVSSPPSIEVGLEDSGGTEVDVSPETVTVTVNQVEATPEHAPVGGLVTSINKLEIVIPYIALTGLIVAVSTVFVIRRRKD